ncbi:MAG: ParB/RepB/Spo0J family partition protein [Bdellovibrionales bacterium]
MSDSNPSTTKSTPKAKGLGRGLGSLLGPTNEGAFSKSTSITEGALERLTEKLESRAEPAIKEGFVETKKEPQIPENARIWKIAIEKIGANPKQPRKIFSKEALQELSQSIAEKGIIQPILVRRTKDDQFEIIAGERRWRAAQLAGLKEVPAIIRETEEQEVLELALIENIQRENLNPIEEAEAYEYLIDRYGLSQGDLAKKVGKDRATVANVLRILNLQPIVRDMITQGTLSLGQAKVLLSVPDNAMQLKLANRAHQEQLTVRALEKLVQQSKDGKTVTASPTPTDREREAAQVREELQRLIGSKVGLDYTGGKGKITIHFYSDGELNQIVDTLRDSWRS